jgi:hypothetical protein
VPGVRRGVEGAVSVLRPNIRDHRGRAVRLCRYGSLPPGPSRGWALMFLLPVFWIPLCVMLMAALALLGKAQLAQPVWTGAALTLPLLSGGLLTCIALLILRHRSARAMTGFVLAEGCCPGCGYRISSTPEELDGCRVCPECGAAWRELGSVPHWIPASLIHMFFALTKDSRGTLRKIVRPAQLGAGLARHMISMAAQSAAAFWFLLISSILCSIPFAIAAEESTADRLLITFLGLLAYGALASAFLGGRWLFLRRGVRLLLRDRLCPACGYRLSGIAPADDGCTVCPECGAAWRFTKNETGRT